MTVIRYEQRAFANRFQGTRLPAADAGARAVNGVREVVIPKLPQVQPQRIAVQAAQDHRPHALLRVRSQTESRECRVTYAVQRRVAGLRLAPPAALVGITEKDCA